MKYLTNTATHIIEQSDSGIYNNYLVKHNGKDPQFKVGDHMRISKCFFKGIYSKLVRGSQTLFDQKSKNAVHGTYIIRDHSLLIIVDDSQ